MGFLIDADALIPLGWKPVFQQQIPDHAEHLVPARITAVQRTGLTLAPELPGVREIPMAGKWFTLAPEERPTVGDWVMVDPAEQAIESILARTSLLKRLNPAGEIQLIAANVDIALLVTSCNADFNLARLERYLSVVLEAGVQPIVVLTKIDLHDEHEQFIESARSLGADIPVECVNALDPGTLDGVRAWCRQGQTLAMLGSSGVGKSTLLNGLMGEAVQATKSIRETDAKGRHTTTHRSLHPLPSGAVMLDSPGMREFQITDAGSGVESTFRDIDALAQQCKFNDCEHASEPGCRVREAIEAGELEERRLHSYFKLVREERYNTETTAERHARARQFGRMVKSHKRKR